MKRQCKKVLTWLLITALLFGALPGIVFAEETPAQTEEQPVQTEVSAFGKRYLAPGGDYTVRTDALPGQKKRGTLPSYYHSGLNGWGTPVRDQNPYGTCWAHGAIASCEMYMIKHGIPVGKGGAAATNDLDLSEYHLSWFTYTDAFDALGLLAGNQNSCASDTHSYLDVGGNGKLAGYTLMRWEGLASEQTPALSYANTDTFGLPTEYAFNYNVAHVQDCIWIPASDREMIKAAIMEYGAGTIGYYHDDAYDSNGAYYYDGYEFPNHDVTVVGWDDSYSRYNFKGAAMPSRDGAWIIKNSWGEAFGDNGYYYLSFEDTSAQSDTCYFYSVEPVDNYMKNYQYDGTSNTVNCWLINDGESIANVFTAEGDEQLAAVAFSNEDAGIDYTLQIYTGVSSNPTEGRLAATQMGTFDYAGYHTVKLDTPVRLKAGETFSVVFTLDNRYGDTTTVPIDEAGYHDIPDWVWWYHPVRMGTSFWWGHENGIWVDVSEAANLRIKAYTNCAHGNTIPTVLTEPTCTEAGSGRFFCNICGKDLGILPIDALGHAFGAWQPLAEAPDMEQRTCSRCPYTQTRERYRACRYGEFRDCKEEWYHEAVDFAVAEGLMKGVGGSKFDPYGTMTRAMVVTVLYRMNGAPTVSEAATFSDIPTGQWYSDAIAWAQDCGVVGGVGNNRFAPEETVTREQIATILWRSEGKPAGSGELAPFYDGYAVSSYAVDAMRWAVGKGIFKGDAGRLKPGSGATRAEYACIMIRYLGEDYRCENMK